MGVALGLTTWRVNSAIITIATMMPSETNRTGIEAMAVALPWEWRLCRSLASGVRRFQTPITAITMTMDNANIRPTRGRLTR
ncbi:MAG: hypothetical protein J2O47_00355 [Acidimicrobiaceae bacterium]|nr:hypothetical protein [Acidimicrobiaceae bacterium]